MNELVPMASPSILSNATTATSQLLFQAPPPSASAISPQLTHWIWFSVALFIMLSVLIPLLWLLHYLRYSAKYSTLPSPPPSPAFSPTFRSELYRRIVCGENGIDYPISDTQNRRYSHSQCRSTGQKPVYGRQYSASFSAGVIPSETAAASPGIVSQSARRVRSATRTAADWLLRPLYFSTPTSTDDQQECQPSSATSSSSSSSNSNNSSSFISYLSSSFKRKNGVSSSSSNSKSGQTSSSYIASRAGDDAGSRSSTLDRLGRRAPSPSLSSSSPGICRRPNIKTRKPVKVGEFDRYYEENHRDTNFGFSQEFDTLNQLCRETIYQQPQARPITGKNRYANIIPYEHTIVKLTQIGSDSNTSYINANYVAGHNCETEYIACQAPLHSTLGDFYRMLIEQNVKVVVNLLERENPPYFPFQLPENVNNNSISSDNVMECEIAMDKDFPEVKSKIRVVLVSDDDREYYRIRTVEIKAEGRPTHRVLQYHYRIWEDFGTPDNARTLIEFVRAVRKQAIRTKSSTITSGRSSPASCSPSPMVVHCNAGVGRTGTFIAVDQLMQTLMPGDFASSHASSNNNNGHHRNSSISSGSEWSFKEKTMRLFQMIQNFASNGERNLSADWQSASSATKVSVIDVFGLVYRLRHYRPFLVQTENQYAFIYDCVRLLLRDAGYSGTRKKKHSTAENSAASGSGNADALL